MTDPHGPWPDAAPPPGWLPPPASRLIGVPPRPRFREPHRIGAGAVLAGLGAGALWMALLGALGGNLSGYAWWSLMAAGSAWIVAVLLSVLGDRGVAVGVAISAGLGWSVATAFVVTQWMSTGDWPMW